MGIFREKRTEQFDNSSNRLDSMKQFMKYNNMESELNTYKSLATRNQTAFNDLCKKVKALCIMILGNKYMQSQLSSGISLSDMDINSLIEIASNEFLQIQSTYRNNVLLLSNTVMEKEKMIEGLLAQISAASTHFTSNDFTSNNEDSVKDNEKMDNSTNDSSESDNNSKDNENKDNSANKSDRVNKEGSSGKDTNDQKTTPVKRSNDINYDIVTEVPINFSSEEHVQGKRIKHSYHQKNKNSNQTMQDLMDNVKSKETEKANSQYVNNETLEQKDKQDVTVNNKVGNNDIQPSDKKEMFHAFDLKVIIDNLDDVMKDTIEIIGKQGVSQSQIIRNILTEEGGYRRTAITTAFGNLEKSQILEKEKIDVGVKWFFVYKLTVSGRRIFTELFHQNPVISECEKLVNENASSFHGYMILIASEILKDKWEYSKVSIERSVNTIKLDNGAKVIPDVIAYKKELNVTDYFEIERGTHVQKEFNEKCDKLRLLSSNIYFIVPDRNTLNTVNQKVSIWLNGKEKDYKKDLKIYIATMKKLASKEYDIIIDCNVLEKENSK